MTKDELKAAWKRYEAAFNEPPLLQACMSDVALYALMLEALEKGRPIPEEDYDRGVPGDALI